MLGELSSRLRQSGKLLDLLWAEASTRQGLLATRSHALGLCKIAGTVSAAVSACAAAALLLAR